MIGRIARVVGAVLALALAALGVVVFRAGLAPATPPAAHPRRPITLPPPLPDPAAEAGWRSQIGSESLRELTGAWREDFGIDLETATSSDAETPVDAWAKSEFAARNVESHSPGGGVLVAWNTARGEAALETSPKLASALRDELARTLVAERLGPDTGRGFPNLTLLDALGALTELASYRALRGELALPAELRKRPELDAKLEHLFGPKAREFRLPKGARSAGWKSPTQESLLARYAPAAEPLASAAAYERALADLAGDPELELFTEGSRVLRAREAFDVLGRARELRRLVASKPLRAVTSGARAVVDGVHPAKGFVPVLLHLEEGVWRVDWVEMRKSFRVGDAVALANAGTPYAFGLGRFAHAPDADVAAWDLGGRALRDVRAELAADETPLHRYLLAELEFRNAFLSADALDHYADAVAHALEDPLFHARLAERARYLGVPSIAVHELEKLGADASLPLARAQLQAGDFAHAAQSFRRAIARNAYDLTPLRELLALFAEEEGRALVTDPGEPGRLAERIESLEHDPQKRAAGLELDLSPNPGVLHTAEPQQRGALKLYDYSEWSVTLRNDSAREVELESLRVFSRGTGASSGLGDILRQVQFPSAPGRLLPGESTVLSNTWGFTNDSKHTHLSYVLECCWHGVGDAVRQCTSARQDLFPE